jgi:hypothetical protein
MEKGSLISTPIPRYTDRVARIKEILSPAVDLTGLIPNTAEANPIPQPNGLACSWGDAETGRTRMAVHISAVTNVDDKIRRLRDKVAEFSFRDGRHDPSSAREEEATSSDVHVFVFGCFGNVEVLVDNCDVIVGAMNPQLELTALIAPAVEIATTVGCSPYENDFEPPVLPEAWQQQRLASPPFPPMGKSRE